MKIIRILFSALFSVIFTIILTVGLFTLTCNLFLSKENINNMVNEIGIEQFVETNESIFEEIDQEYLKIPEVKELIDKLINSSVDYIMNDKDIPRITEEDINKIVNSNYYEMELGITLTEEEKIEYSNNLKEQYVAVNESFEENLNVVKNSLFEEDIVKLIFSSQFKLIIIGSLIGAILIIVICNWSFYKPLSWIGVSLIIAGILTVIGSYIIKPYILENGIEGVSAEVINILLKKWTTYGIISTITGVILIIIYYIIRINFVKSNEDKLLESL